MAEKDHLPLYPLPRIKSNGRIINAKFDEESDPIHESHQDLHDTNRIQYLAYSIVFLVSQTGIILLFSLTIMKVRTPKFSVGSATFKTFDVVVGTTTTNPSFNLRMNVELGIKNNNFGDYKFLNSTVYFHHNGYSVGEAVVPKSEAGIRSTKNFMVSVNLLSPATRKDSKILAKDLGSGVITLESRSKLNGKVELMKVLKKKKSTNMDCQLTIGVADRTLHQISCK